MVRTSSSALSGHTMAATAMIVRFVAATTDAPVSITTSETSACHPDG